MAEPIQRRISTSPAGRPTLAVETRAQSVRLTADRVATIGREGSCDIVVDSHRVSRRHAELSWAEGGWLFRDLHSSNGTWLGDRRIQELPIRESVNLHLGGVDGPIVSLSLHPLDTSQAARAEGPDSVEPDPSSPGRLTAIHTVVNPETRIGRNPDNDLAVDDLTVSRYHAVIRRLGTGEFELLDLGSSNGTFVNGQAVERHRLLESDIVSIGSHLFEFRAGALREYAGSFGAWLSASNVWVRVRRNPPFLARMARGIRSSELTLLVDIGFAVEPSSLLGIVGPSGAGKTTLLKAVTGQQPAGQGQILYGGRDLYSALDLRRRMGYVPQEDLLHPQLTVRQALSYAAELRFAQDVDRSARSDRVDEVMRELGLQERADLAISKLSGGQRKRTSVAAEMLTKPSLLFLDEPTSGLDPGNEEQVTALLRDLADDGRTVVTATHSLVTLERCDRVLFLARGGHMAFFGPANLAIDFFRNNGFGDSYPRVFGALAEGDGQRFTAAFRADPMFEEYVERPLERAVSAPPTRVADVEAQTRHDRFRQFGVLVRRYAAVLRADRTSALILVAQAPFFALLFGLLYSNNVMRSSNASEATILMWLLIVGATWMGTSNAIREVIKELPILRREHGLGLSLGAYVASKIAVLSAITGLQCVVLAFATMVPQQLPAVDNTVHPQIAVASAGALVGSQSVELAIDVVLAGLASMGLGLLLSAATRNADQANFALPLVLVAQIVLSAPLVGAPGPVFAVLGATATAQWGTGAAAATVNLNAVRSPYLGIIETQRAAAEGNRLPDPDVARGRPTWDHTIGSWLLNAVALAVILSLSIAGLFLALRAQLEINRGSRPLRKLPP